MVPDGTQLQKPPIIILAVAPASSQSPHPRRPAEGGEVTLVEHHFDQHAGWAILPTRIALRLVDAGYLPTAYDGHDLPRVDADGDHRPGANVGAAP